MNKKKIKIFAIIFLFLIIIGGFSSIVSAMTNSNYGSSDKNTVEVDEDAIIKSSIVTDYIGSFIYTIGTLIESVTSKVMSLFTGEKVFPWADKVIFNAVPLLDVNFINPSPNSLLAESDTKLSIGGIVRSIYFTGLSVALGFLSIIIAVMAIKLAISTISSEKAKYKEAIVKWLTSLILLFGMHFGLSLIFYLNEQLVEVASTMLNNVLTDDEYNKISEKINSATNETKDEIIDAFHDAIDQSVLWEQAWPSDAIKNALWSITSSKEAFTELRAEENKDIIYYLLKDPVILENVIPNVSGNGQTNGLLMALKSATTFSDTAVGPQLSDFLHCVTEVKNISKDDAKNIEKRISDTNQEIKKLEDEIGITGPIDIISGKKKRLKQAQVDLVVYKMALNIKKGDISADDTARQYNVISSLGTFFKDKAWYADTENGEWSANSVSVVSAILYTIFVIESLMFFIAYVKRFFYVVILSVIAPFVVIYDFFVKSATL